MFSAVFDQYFNTQFCHLIFAVSGFVSTFGPQVAVSIDISVIHTMVWNNFPSPTAELVEGILIVGGRRLKTP